MDTVLSLSGIEPRDRLDYWHDVASKVFVDHEGSVTSPATFNATVRQAPLGELKLVHSESLGLETVQRTARNIVNGEDDVFLLCLQLEGEAVMCQDGREAVIRPGEFTLLDAQRPYSCRYDLRKQITVKIPHRALKSRIDAGANLTAHTLRNDGPAEFLASYLTMLRDSVNGLPEVAASRIAEHVLDLTALSLTAFAGTNTPALSSARMVTLLRLRMAIESRLSDPDLTPTTAAAAVGISVRYANALLSKQGLSLQRLIVSRRLERCRQAFQDPRQASRTVGEIAYGWGFSDLSHFNRRFKAAFGCSPRDYRRQHLA
jgi:AraC-like DNA-binding protein